MTTVWGQREGWTGKHSLAAAALLLLLAGSIAVMVWGFGRGFGWIGAVGITAAIMGFAQLAGQAMAKKTVVRPAMRRHIYRTQVASIIYVATLFMAVWAFNSGLTAGPLGYVIAIVPALPALVMFGSFFLILKQENDEFIRIRIIEAVMWAMGLTLAEALIWGFLEMFGKVPHVWMWVVPLVFVMQLGIAQSILWRRYR